MAVGRLGDTVGNGHDTKRDRGRNLGQYSADSAGERVAWWEVCTILNVYLVRWTTRTGCTVLVWRQAEVVVCFVDRGRR